MVDACIKNGSLEMRVIPWIERSYAQPYQWAYPDGTPLTRLATVNEAFLIRHPRLPKNASSPTVYPTDFEERKISLREVAQEMRVITIKNFARRAGDLTQTSRPKPP